MTENIPIDPYEACLTAIKQRVCAVCLDQKDDGGCGLYGRTCAIERHLPALVAAVGRIESDRMDEYVAALESEVCARCAEQDPSGRCRLRAGGQCALHAYLPFIVDVVQELREDEGGSLVPAPRRHPTP